MDRKANQKVRFQMHWLQILASTACLLLCSVESSPVRSAREVLRTLGQATAAKMQPSTSIKGETRPAADNDIERQDSLPAALKAASSCLDTAIIDYKVCGLLKVAGRQETIVVVI